MHATVLIAVSYSVDKYWFERQSNVPLLSTVIFLKQPSLTRYIVKYTLLLTWLTAHTLTNICSKLAKLFVLTSNVCTKPSSCLSMPDSLCRNSCGEPDIWYERNYDCVRLIHEFILQAQFHWESVMLHFSSFDISLFVLAIR